MAKTKPFDENLQEYEQWFADFPFVFRSELEAIKKVLLLQGKGIEIGVGSGIFASALGIKDGVEPSPAMRRKAEERNINAIDGVAENLPVADNSYDFALMVTTICFIDDVVKSFNEVKRILKKNGVFVIGFVDRDSDLGKLYLKIKDQNVFYRDAVFYSFNDIYSFLKETGFKYETAVQTIFGPMESITEIQKPETGHGEGGFLALKAIKQ